MRYWLPFWRLKDLPHGRCLCGERWAAPCVMDIIGRSEGAKTMAKRDYKKHLLCEVTCFHIKQISLLQELVTRHQKENLRKFPQLIAKDRRAIKLDTLWAIGLELSCVKMSFGGPPAEFVKYIKVIWIWLKVGFCNSPVRYSPSRSARIRRYNLILALFPRLYCASQWES